MQRGPANYRDVDVCRRCHRVSVTELYAAGGALLLAQVVGIYGLVTRKADLVFSILMVLLVVAAVVLALYGANAIHHL